MSVCASSNAKQGGTTGLGWRELGTGRIGRVVLPYEEDGPTSVIAHGDDNTQILVLGLSLGGRHHLACCLERECLLVRELRERAETGSSPGLNGLELLRLLGKTTL
jgi:hypothetical protein